MIFSSHQEPSTWKTQVLLDSGLPQLLCNASILRSGSTNGFLNGGPNLCKILRILSLPVMFFMAILKQKCFAGNTYPFVAFKQITSCMNFTHLSGVGACPIWKCSAFCNRGSGSACHLTSNSISLESFVASVKETSTGS